MDSTPALNRLTAAIADRYRIEKELGSGGMATVYLAEDIKHHRKVAIKVLREDIAATLGAKRFLREIEIAAQLQHPNILPLLDSGDADGFLFYVMPFVAGQSLRERLGREVELPIHEAVRLLVEVVDALAHAHELGVVHRDIKPDNVMLSGRHALVTDFGVAKAISEATGRNTVTTLGIALGTPAYMSPEQAAADPHVDHRTDIYAVGVLAYELLAGRPPFTGTTPQQILAAHVNVDPVPVSQLRPGVPALLEQIVMRCLAKRAADRFQTAQELLLQLEPLATPSTGITPAQTRPVDARGFAQSGAGRLVAGGVLLAAITIALIALFRDRTPTLTLGAATAVTSDAGLEIFPTISPDGKFVAYSARAHARARAVRVFVKPVGGTRTIPVTDDTVGNQTQPRFSPDGQSILFLTRGGVFAAPALGGPSRALIAPVTGAGVTSAAWSPKGDGIAFVRRESLYVAIPYSAPPRLLAKFGGVRSCHWSAAGDYIVCTEGNSTAVNLGGADFGNVGANHLVAVSVGDGAVTTVSDTVTFNQSPILSHDGKWLYYVSTLLGSRDVFMVRFSKGRTKGNPIRVTVGLNAQTISLSADDHRLAYSVYNATGNIYAIPVSATDTASATAVTSGKQIVEWMHVSRDGKWLLYDSDLHGNSDIFRLRLDGGPPERLTTDSAVELGGDLSPDGKEITFHSFLTGARDVYVQSIVGGMARNLTASAEAERYPVWSPDGNAIAYDRNSTAWMVRRDANGNWGTAQFRGQFRYPRWSPDSRLLVGASAGKIYVAPADSGPATLVYGPRPGTQDPATVNYADWSADGKSIVFRGPAGARGRATFWSVPLAGGAPRIVGRLWDERLPAFRNEWGTDGKRFYVSVNDRQADIWVVDLTSR